MSGKLDQSLDDILGNRKKSGPRRSSRRTARPAKVAAPAGGITKGGRAPKAAPKKVAPPTGPSNAGPSKIMVSGLPTDVTESQIKEYFVGSVGPVKKVLLTYGPSGQSRGVATVIFSGTKAAADAAKLLDGTKVDGRPMRVEVIVTAKDAPAAAPIKALADRVSAKKNEAKNATKATAAKAKGKVGNKPRGRGGNQSRPKKKNAEQLDADMDGYFGTTNGAGTNGVAAGQTVAAGGDSMETYE